MDIKQFRDRIFEEGRKLGFTNLEVYYEKTSNFNVKLFKGEIDGHESSTVNGVSVRGLYDGKMGYAYTERLDEDTVHFLLENAKENALLIEDEPEELYDGKGEYADYNFYSPSLEQTSAEEKIALMKEIERKIYELDDRVVQTDYAVLSEQSFEKAIFNNKGLEVNDKNNFMYVVFSVVVKEGEEIKSGFTFKVGKDLSKFNADEIAKEAVDRALSYLGGKTYPNKMYPVILQNEAAASLLATFVPIFSAEAVQKGQSQLKGKIGEKISSDILTLIDDPFLPNGLRSGTFDSEGVPTRKLAIVENGKLQTFFYNLKTAKKDGVESTGHGYKPSYQGTIGISPTNFYIVPSETSYEQLYCDLEEGIIITNLAGLHSGANQISGDFSLAANGYYVKDGEIVGATNLMTIAGNFFELLKDVEQVGSDLAFSPMGMQGYIGSPSLKIKSLTVTID
ncbi:TldD/PmbA family protein [Pallidibacillus pasinlerensis]|uniref:TldD/PmbA family protein n=1 Tax=Pallidibacillus pasinlerensis TaxID=2703818 RepID=A0ABX0A3G4_9BACI|nr:TldD/PmbA family protein [Pallidibacillus pasinlerensis]NCU17937.1 TldD/PmbA family protein [Pallidibacillus pasinlerensis]